MLYLLGYSGPGQLRIFGQSNEKYHVRGGNDQIPTRLAQALQGQINLGSELTAIKRNSDGTYRLSFKLSGGGTSTVTADRVVLALPFSILRTLDYSKAGFSDAQEDRDQGARAWGRTPSSTSSSPTASGTRSATTATPTPTPATRTPGR